MEKQLISWWIFLIIEKNLWIKYNLLLQIEIHLFESLTLSPKSLIKKGIFSVQELIADDEYVYLIALVIGTFAHFHISIGMVEDRKNEWHNEIFE